MPRVLRSFHGIKWASIIGGSYENSRLMPEGAQCVWTRPGEWHCISITSMSSLHPWIRLISIPTVILVWHSESQTQRYLVISPISHVYICCSHTLMEFKKTKKKKDAAHRDEIWTRKKAGKRWWTVMREHIISTVVRASVLMECIFRFLSCKSSVRTHVQIIWLWDQEQQGQVVSSFSFVCLFNRDDATKLNTHKTHKTQCIEGLKLYLFIPLLWDNSFST